MSVSHRLLSPPQIFRFVVTYSWYLEMPPFRVFVTFYARLETKTRRLHFVARFATDLAAFSRMLIPLPQIMHPRGLCGVTGTK